MSENVNTKSLFSLDKAELSQVLKTALKTIINPDSYAIENIGVKGNGLVLSIAYYYLPTEQPEPATLTIVDISRDFSGDNIKISFDSRSDPF